MAWTLKLFGGARLGVDGGPASGAASQRQRLALLAILATSPGGVSRHRLLALLWPDSDPERARHALSNALYGIRKELPPGALIGQGEELRIDPHLLAVDVHAFEQAVGQGRFEDAADIYAGPFLDHFSVGVVEFEHWADGERAALAERHRAVIEALADAALVAGRLDEVVRWRRRLAVTDPLDTTYALALMRALDDSGDAISALRHGQVHAAMLESQLQLSPDPRIAELSEEIRARGGGEGPERLRQRDPSTPRPVPSISSPPTPPPAPPALRGPSLLPRWILAGLVVLLAVGALARSLREQPSDLDSIRRLAVLPLDNLSPDRDQAYFADAMTEVLTSELARIDRLSVVSRTSSARYRDSGLSLDRISSELGVDAVVEGSVFRSGDDLRITAQLVATNPERHLWAASFEGRVGDAIGLQRVVASNVAETIARSLSPATEPPRSEQALEAYFLGISRQQHFTRQGVESAIEAFETAVATDSTFADGWAKLAESFWMLTQPLAGMPHTLGMQRARDAADRAVALSPTHPLATVVQGWVELFYDWSPRRAEASFRRVIDSEPDQPSGHAGLSFALSAQARHDEAVEAARRAKQLEPLVLSFRTSLAEVLLYAGRYDEGRAEVGQALAMDPSFERAHVLGRWLAEAEEDWETALAHARERAQTLGEAEPTDGVERTRQGYWHWLLDRVESGAAPSAMDLAWVHAELGDGPRSIAHLQRAAAARDGGIVLLGVAPQWASLRADPALRASLEAVMRGDSALGEP